MATEVVMPMLGITVEKGKIVEWLKNEGDPVEKLEIIFVVEVEKATTEVESPASGILAKILVPIGIEVPVLTVVAIITEIGEELPTEYTTTALVAPPAEGEVATHAKLESFATEQKAVTAESGGPIGVVPAARKLAQDRCFDLKIITGTGPEGVILLRDVKEALKAKTEPTVRVSTLARRLAEKEDVSLGGFEGTGVRGRIMKADLEQAIQEETTPGLGGVIQMDTMRRVIARRMTESAFTAPHIHFFTDVWMEPLIDFRQDILPDFEKKFGLRPSINDFLIKAVALNILDFPILNATLKGEEIHILPEVNICLAVALPEGLIVPAIANADKVGLAGIIQQREDLVLRARSGKLSTNELERGSFTISSLTQYDIAYFTAILNPPQSGILTVGKTRDELAMIDGEVRVKKVSTFGLSVDHRIIDGAVAADFLQNLKWKLERPSFSFLTV